MIDTKQMAKYIFEEYANCYSQVDIEELAKHLDEIKSEAIKEFAEKVSEQFKVLEYMPKIQRKTLPVVVVKQQVDGILQNGCPHIVNKALKEMVGEDK